MSRKRKSDQESTNTDSTTITATNQPSSTKNVEEKRSFVDSLGERDERVAAPDPFLLAGDFALGMRLFESRLDRQMAIKFDEKPSQAVIDRLKDADFRWNPADRVWTYPVWRESPMTSRIDAERVYQEVREMVRQEKGLETTPEVPR